MSDTIKKPEQIPALNGVRGYGFLAVFIGHYLTALIAAHRANPLVNGAYYLEHLAWLAVPGFFVLSGYLIGGILYRSRDRRGFFRVFYGRRALRVLPVYYVTLIVVAVVDLAHGVHLDYKYWAHFIYIQNLMPGYSYKELPPYNQVIHLWTLAVEEQFYLTWPLVVWFAKDRKTLLKIVVAICALSFILRIVAPLIHLSPTRAYYATPTRIDSILFGVALALVVDHPIYQRIRHLAKYVVVVGPILWLASLTIRPDYPDNYFRLAVDCTSANIIMLAVLVAALEEGSTFARVLSYRWVCWLGNMSYGLYVFHLTYRTWFFTSLRPMLLEHMSETWAFPLTVVLALALTIVLGMLSWNFLEKPALSLKRFFTYGRDLPTNSIAVCAERETSLAPSPTPSEDLPQGLHLAGARNGSRLHS